jgi:hypothetical protein
MQHVLKAPCLSVCALALYLLSGMVLYVCYVPPEQVCSMYTQIRIGRAEPEAVRHEMGQTAPSERLCDAEVGPSIYRSASERNASILSWLL